MGQRTTVSGHVQESWYVREDEVLKSMSRHNDEVLDALPTLFAKSPSGTGINFLTRAMFCTTERVDGLASTWSLPGYRGRIIHFAGAYSSLWDQWTEWLETFEELLGQLYWENAAVTQINEWMPGATCKWRAGKIDYDTGLTLPEPPAIRLFEGPRSLDEVSTSDS